MGQRTSFSPTQSKVNSPTKAWRSHMEELTQLGGNHTFHPFMSSCQAPASGLRPPWLPAVLAAAPHVGKGLSSDLYPEPWQAQ